MRGRFSFMRSLSLYPLRTICPGGELQGRKRADDLGGPAMIVINLDIMMAKRKIGLTELAAKVDLSPANLSILKNGKGKAIRFSTLDRICKQLECQPGDILQYVEGASNEDD